MLNFLLFAIIFNSIPPIHLSTLPHRFVSFQHPTIYQQAQLNEDDAIRAFYTADNTTPQLGEHVTITLTITAPTPLTLEQVPAFPDDRFIFETLIVGEPMEQTENGFWQYTRSDTIILWQLGEHTTPEQIIRFNGLQMLPIQSVTFTVMSTLPVEEDIALRPDFSQRDLPYTPIWVFVGGILSISAIVSVVIWVIIRRTRRNRAFANSDFGRDTLQRLIDIGHTTTDSTLALALVSNTLRQYIQQKCHINASEMTTDELNEAIENQTTIPNEQRRQVIKILEQADLVKFAQFTIDDRAIGNMIGYAIRWVETVEQVLKQQDDSMQAGQS